MRVFSKKKMNKKELKEITLNPLLTMNMNDLIQKINRKCSKQNSRETISRTRISKLRGLNDIVEIIKESNNLIELIYSIESLAYYFDMKPNEFWNSRYSEINVYCQTHLMKIIDDLKREINLQEAVTNKLIAGDCMNQNAKD